MSADGGVKLIEGKRPECIIDMLAVLLIAPAIIWIIAMCWVFGGPREARKAYYWMFEDREDARSGKTP